MKRLGEACYWVLVAFAAAAIVWCVTIGFHPLLPEWITGPPPR